MKVTENNYTKQWLKNWKRELYGGFQDNNFTGDLAETGSLSSVVAVSFKRQTELKVRQWDINLMLLLK